MAAKTIFIGALLIIIGVGGYLLQDPNAGKVSWTALIPAIMGGVIAFCGVLAMKDNLRKHVMHLAAMVGLFGVFGGFMPIQRQVSEMKKANPELSSGDAWGQVDLLKTSAMSGWLMSLICLVFVILCIKSFIDARKARDAAKAVGSL